jgi:hypothetical protein
MPRVGRVLLTASMIALIACAACKADLPRLTDADDDLGDACTLFADELVLYAPADETVTADGAVALGMPDDVIVPVVPDDVLTIAFIGLGGVEELDTEDELPAPDIRVHGTAAPGTEVTVLLSTDGELFEQAGTVGTPDDLDTARDLDIDIADGVTLTLASYVQLVGVTGALDVDAFEALQSACPDAGP